MEALFRRNSGKAHGKPIDDKGSYQNVTSNKFEGGELESQFTSLKMGPACYHCENTGHLILDCWSLKKRRRVSESSCRIS